MNIDHIEAFLYVVHLKSIHRAADALFLSQPTVTARIKALEKDLNVALFRRDGRGIVLTEQGKSFIPYAEQIIKAYKQGQQKVKGKDVKDEIIIGANVIASQYFMSFALPLWKKQLPDLRIQFISGRNEEIAEKVLQGQIDIAFIRDLQLEGVIIEEVLDNSVRLVVLPNHPFVQLEQITVEQLAQQSMVFFECGAFDWNRVHKLFEAANVEPTIEFQVNHLEVAKSIILNGQAIGFLPYLCIKNELDSGALMEIDVVHFLEIKQNIFLTYRNVESIEKLLPIIRTSIKTYKNS